MLSKNATWPTKEFTVIFAKWLLLRPWKIEVSHPELLKKLRLHQGFINAACRAYNKRWIDNKFEEFENKWSLYQFSLVHLGLTSASSKPVSGKNFPLNSIVARALRTKPT